MDKKILDVTCGARTIWFDKHHPAAIYCDRRREEYQHLWKNAGNCSLSIDPDVLCDFTALPFPDDAFPLVVFDPPHLTGAKETALLHDGFAECMRVLKPDGVLIFKWSEYNIPAESMESHRTETAFWTPQRQKLQDFLGMLHENYRKPGGNVISFSIELPQTYTFSLCIDRGNRTLVDTTVEVQATAEGIAKAKRTVQRMMNDYALPIEVVKVGAPKPMPSELAPENQAPIDPTDLPEPETAPTPPPEKKPEGVRGLVRLHCPECDSTFGTYLKERQSSIVCRCGHSIDLTGSLASYRFTCPYCEKESWGMTNLEDPDITIRCKCGRDVELRWVPKEKEYRN